MHVANHPAPEGVRINTVLPNLMYLLLQLAARLRAASIIQVCCLEPQHYRSICLRPFVSIPYHRDFYVFIFVMIYLHNISCYSSFPVALYLLPYRSDISLLIIEDMKLVAEIALP